MKNNLEDSVDQILYGDPEALHHALKQYPGLGKKLIEKLENALVAHKLPKEIYIRMNPDYMKIEFLQFNFEKCEGYEKFVKVE